MPNGSYFYNKIVYDALKSVFITQVNFIQAYKILAIMIIKLIFNHNWHPGCNLSITLWF